MRNIYDDETIGARPGLGLIKLHTPEEVDNTFRNHRGTLLVFVDSACGCSARIARPALQAALQHPERSAMIATVFASTDREATLQARKYFTDQPPSSPAFAFLRDGKLLGMIHRSDIQTSTPAYVTQLLTEMFDRYCRE